MGKTTKELLARQRAITAELTNCTEERSAELQAEYQRNKMQIELNNQEAQAEQLQRSQKSKMTICAAIRSAAKNENKTILIRSAREEDGEMFRTAAGANVAEIGGNVVETEIQPILEPLYAQSALAKLNVRHYDGVPKGNLSIPVMGPGNVGWEGEIGEAKESKHTYTYVTLKPHRLTAFVDISKQLILQETAGANEALHRDLVNAIKDKFEATIFGAGDGSIGEGEEKKEDVAPKGIFNGKSLSDATTFAKLVGIEASIEDANVTGECMYLMNTKAKADLRVMPTNGAGSKRVMEAGTVDGTNAVVTSNVKTAGAFVYGDWSKFASATWDGIEITVDPYTRATFGQIRLVVNAYMDAKMLLPEAFAFGKTRN